MLIKHYSANLDNIFVWLNYPFQINYCIFHIDSPFSDVIDMYILIHFVLLLSSLLYHIMCVKIFTTNLKMKKLTNDVLQSFVSFYDYFLQQLLIASHINCAVPSPCLSMFSLKRSSAMYISPSPASISLVQV